MDNQLLYCPGLKCSLIRVATAQGIVVESLTCNVLLPNREERMAVRGDEE